MLNLNKRAATLGTSFNGRVQRKGASDEKEPAFDVQLDGIVIGEKEFNALLGDAHADECFFDEPGRKASAIMPKFPNLAPLALKEKIKGVKVSIWLQGEDDAIVLDACNLNRITLEPQEGGTVSPACQVQCAGPSDKAVSRIFDHLTQTCWVEIVEAQRDLTEQAA